MKIVFILVTMSLALVTANGDLEQFAAALMTAVTSEKSFNYDLSGVAKVTKIGRSYLDSGSLYSKDPQAALEKPEDVSQIPAFSSYRLYLSCGGSTHVYFY